MAQLYNVDSPINREQRNNLNLTFQDIQRRFSAFQNQLNVIVGGEIEGVLNDIQKAIQDSQTTNAQLMVVLNNANQKIAEVNTSISNANAAITRANTATNNANTARDNANTAANNANTATNNANSAITRANTATTNANSATSDARAAIVSTNTATSNANNATTNANTARANADAAIVRADAATSRADAAANSATQAVQRLQESIVSMKSELQNYMDSFVHLNNFEISTQYRKNNEVLYFGSTWRAKNDTLGNPPPTSFTDLNSENWQLIARRGEDSPSQDDAITILRSSSEPANTNIIWWFDTDYTTPETIIIYRSQIPPSDTKQLWLAPRGV